MKLTLRRAISKSLLVDLRQIIVTAKHDVARRVNSTLVLLYWRVGQRIRQDILMEQRAEYGEQIVSAVGRQLTAEFGRGFSEKSVRHMVRFAEVFPDAQIVSALLRQLSWTHFRRLIYIEDALKRDFYGEMCRVENWSTRTLEKKIGGMLFERTALSRKPDALIRRELDQLRSGDKVTPDLVFRDPYILDFLGLKDRYVEKLLEVEKSGIRVASYWTELLPKKLLQRKLHQAIVRAREHVDGAASKKKLRNPKKKERAAR